MPRTALVLPLALAAWLLAGAAWAVTGPVAEFKKLAEDVYAYIGKVNDANAMVIVTSQGVVLVDTGNSQPDTRDIQKKIQSVTSQPVRYVVITQNHGDHIGGTPLFSPPATVIVHDRVARDLNALKPYQIRTWRKRFPERAEALKDINPIDTVVSFPDRMTLNLGGKRIELLYIDDEYNIGDVAVWLPDQGIMHGSFAGYKDRHPDIRPDYSHGTTWGMLKQLEALIALKPKIVVPAHGPLSTVTDLETVVDYLLTARHKVRSMMDKGMDLATIEKNFEMNEFKDWDRGSHLPWLAETIWREVQGMGPQIVKSSVQQAKGTLAKIAEEGRFLTVTTDQGKELRLRISSDSDIEGIPDRSAFKTGQKLAATYQVPENFNPALGYDVEEVTVTP